MPHTWEEKLKWLADAAGDPEQDSIGNELFEDVKAMLDLIVRLETIWTKDDK